MSTPTPTPTPTLLHIDSSILGASSASRSLSAAVVRHYRERQPELALRYRDLDAAPIPHLTGAALAGADAEGAALGEAVLQEFLDASVVVVGVPMYNFGIPSTLKAWIDRITVAGRSFRYTAEGPVGLAGDKQVLLAVTRGGVYAEGAAGEHQVSYLRFLFRFLGVEPKVLTAEGLKRSDADPGAIVNAALDALDAA